MDKNNMISGAKKGGSGRVAVEATDTLRSKAYASVLDAIGEGEIEGLVNGAKSIYLDGTRLQNDDDSFNFEGVSFETRNGTQGQTHIEGFPAVENEVSVGVEVKKANAVARTLTNVNLDMVRVKLLIPQLSSQDKKTGDLNGSSVKIALEVSSAGGPFERVKEDEINGKTMSRYERSYEIQLRGSAPWVVRMVRLTDDSATASVQNQTWFSSYTEVINTKLSYPNTALVGVRVDASQFSQIPQRAYHMRLLRVQVPTNYDPQQRTYSGSWDGTFKIAWTNNPAWCFYDLLTNTRYGLGQNIAAEAIDKWSLYRIGKYCDEPVPDGKGGTEPRFTLNCYMQTREDAYKVLNDMASAFRGMLYWANGTVVATHDSPADAGYLFSNANVVEGTFTYSGVSVKQRHTVALVSWNDMNDLGRSKVEYVQDEDGIRRYGVVETEVSAFGCTSQAQAHRVGRWILMSELTETETVTFSSGAEGVTAHPGMIIKVRDNYRNGTRLGGRVSAATANTITVDAPITDASGGRLYVVAQDGTVHESVATVSGANRRIINMATPMATPAIAGATWILSLPGDFQDKDYRVISVAEKGDGTYEITALEHNADKYAVIDTGTKIGGGTGGGANPGGPGTGGTPVPAPKNVKLTVVPYTEGTAAKFRLIMSWEPGGSETKWELNHTREGQATVNVGEVNSPVYEIADAAPGHWSMNVRAVATGNKKSAWVSASAFVGVRDMTGAISWIRALEGFFRITLEWVLNPTLAAVVDKIEIWAYRPSVDSAPALVGTVSGVSNSWTHNDLTPDVVWNYRIRAIDKHGNASPFFPPSGINATAAVDVTRLLESIQDSFVNSQFYKDLGTRIDNITLPDIGELTERLEGPIQERLDRISRDQNTSDELLLRSVLVDEQIKEDARDAEARITESVNIVRDGLALEVARRQIIEVDVEDTKAQILTEQQARADGDAALASSITGLRSEFQGTDAATRALIVQEANTRATQDSALATRLDSLTAEVGENVNARILTEQQVRATQDAALASQIQALSAEVNNDLGELSAQIVTEQQARANADGALATSVSGITARLNNVGADGAPGSIEAAIAQERTARTTGDAAVATMVGQVSARLNNINGEGVTVEEKFTANASAVNGLFAQYSVKIDNAGYVSGFGLSSTAPVNGTPTSSFLVRADRFAIGSPAVPGGAAKDIVPFSVFTTPTEINLGKNGEDFRVTVQPGVYINGALMVNGSINANAIDTRGLLIRDENGRVIFGAGTRLNMSQIIGYGSLALRDGIGYSEIAGEKPPIDATAGATIGNNVRFSDGRVMRESDFVHSLSRISSATIQNFMDTTAITTAYIGVAAVDTLRIGGEAATKVRGATHTWSAALDPSSEATLLDYGFVVPAGAGTGSVIIQATTPMYVSDATSIAAKLMIYVDGVKYAEIGATANGNSHMIAAGCALTGVTEGYHGISIRMGQVPPWTGHKTLNGTLTLVVLGALR